MTFAEKYPVAAHEALHFPLMFPESLRKAHIPGIKYPTLAQLYAFGRYVGIQEGTIRTTLSRMKKEGTITVTDAGGVTRYRAAKLQNEAMANVENRKRVKDRGFTVAVFAFEKSQEKERVQTRSLLEYTGFVRFAQNSYINLRIESKELRQKFVTAGLAGNVFIFDVPGVHPDELALLSAAWKIPERVAFLEGFYADIMELIERPQLSDEDTFNRIGAAWIAFIIHIHNKELPLPDSMLPKNYPYGKIYSYLQKASKRRGQSMFRHYTKTSIS
jgi:DNA-binding transcriptional regulator PaaX